MRLFDRVRRRPSGGPAAMRARLEGAMSRRRLRGWNPPLENINALVASGGPRLLARSRELVVTNGYAANACEAFAANLVGDGIKPSSLIGDADLRDRVQRLWLAWTDEADADGLTDFYGLQAMVAREMFVAGECFVRLRPRRAEDGLPVPLQLQLLQSEMLPFEKTETALSGNRIRCGIEFDAIGRRVAYHFRRRHPGDSTDQGPVIPETVRVPAEDVLHIYRPIDAGQIRGLPHVAPAMVRLSTGPGARRPGSGLSRSIFSGPHDCADLVNSLQAAGNATFFGGRPEHFDGSGVRRDGTLVERPPAIAGQPDLDPAQLVFIDETWAKKNMMRTHGRCRRGERLRMAAPHAHWKTTTFVAGLTLSGLIAPFVIDGAINGEAFETYVAKVLVPELRPGAVVVMDNLGSHKSVRVRELIEAAGARLLFLPPGVSFVVIVRSYVCLYVAIHLTPPVVTGVISDSRPPQATRVMSDRLRLVTPRSSAAPPSTIKLGGSRHCPVSRGAITRPLGEFGRIRASVGIRMSLGLAIRTRRQNPCRG